VPWTNEDADPEGECPDDEPGSGIWFVALDQVDAAEDDPDDTHEQTPITADGSAESAERCRICPLVQAAEAITQGHSTGIRLAGRPRLDGRCRTTDARDSADPGVRSGTY
jgi:hypothetical protein